MLPDDAFENDGADDGDSLLAVSSQSESAAAKDGCKDELKGDLKGEFKGESKQETQRKSTSAKSTTAQDKGNGIATVANERACQECGRSLRYNRKLDNGTTLFRCMRSPDCSRHGETVILKTMTNATVAAVTSGLVPSLAVSTTTAAASLSAPVRAAAQEAAVTIKPRSLIPKTKSASVSKPPKRREPDPAFTFDDGDCAMVSILPLSNSGSGSGSGSGSSSGSGSATSSGSSAITDPASGTVAATATKSVFMFPSHTQV
jgi:uncharacterized membrane protein YgcG